MNKKGMSIAELLVVVVVMGVIAAIAIPLVANTIETMKKKAFIDDIVAISESRRLYTLANGETSEELSVKNDLNLYLSKDFSSYKKASTRKDLKLDVTRVDLKNQNFETRVVTKEGNLLVYSQESVPVNDDLAKYVVKNKN